MKKLFFFLTILVTLLVLWPHHNFQHYIAQGDHGRDLYCFKKTMEGALPYRDYSWLFGPLMPFYYSLIYMIFGVSIQSVLLGYLLLIFCVTILFFLICSVFMTPAMSFLCSIWYLTFRGTEFFYTYNHIGGVLAMLTAVYFLFRYIEAPRRSYVNAGFFSLFVLTLIRSNMGVSSLVAFLGSLCLIDFVKKNPDRTKNRIYFLCIAFIAVAIALVIYWFLVHGLPSYVIKQSFPFSQSQRADTASPLDSVVLLGQIMIYIFNGGPYRWLLSCLFLLLALQFVIVRLKNKLAQDLKVNMILVLSSLGIFTFLNLHEFIASGIAYRLYWVMPFGMIALFYFSDVVCRNMLTPIVRKLFLCSLLVVCWLGIRNQLAIIQYAKMDQNALVVGNNKVYTLQQPWWFQTVVQTTQFIKQHIPENEMFFALPFDPLYYFLTGRDSPTRQLMFFEHFKMPKEQELEVIADLEKKHVNYILLSSRCNTLEGGMGTLGSTYCPFLARYIIDNFKVIAIFGDWVNDAGWAWNHGTKILKRKSPL